MATINEQLNIPILKGGETMYQPNLYGGGIDNYIASYTPLVKGTAYYQGANGESWSGCNSCGGYNNAVGSPEVCFGKCQVLHPLNKEKREACINECKQKYSINSALDLVGSNIKDQASVNAIKENIAASTSKGVDKTNTNNTIRGNDSASGMSNNTKIILGVGAIAVVGVLFLVLRRKNK